MQALIYGLSKTEIERHYPPNNSPNEKIRFEHAVHAASTVEVKTDSFSVGDEPASVKWRNLIGVSFQIRVTISYIKYIALNIFAT